MRSLVRGFLALCILLSMCYGQKGSGQVIALLNANVVPMDSERVLEHQTILIQGDRILAMGPTEQLKPDSHALRIDCTGKYVIPGLSDMHVHLQRERNLDLNGWMMKLFVANGITTVRNMWGIPEHLDLRRSVARGEMIGPTIVTSGPIIDGSPPVWKDSTVVQTVEEARAAVLEQHQLGYDFVKVYSHLTPEAYYSIVTTAHDLGMPVVGHTPIAVGIKGVLAARQKSIEHLEGYVLAVESDHSPVLGRSDWYSQMVANGYIDMDKLRAIAKATTAAQTWNCPTLVAAANWVSPKSLEKMRSQEDMRYVPEPVWDQWTALLNAEFRRYSTPDLEKLQRAKAARIAILQALHSAGARLLAGTDTPNPLVPPGFSLHEELGFLVTAGLTPYEALRASTRDAAEFLGRLDTSGTVTPGKLADLVVLDSNPVEKIENTSKISGVVLRGRWFSRSQLDALMQESKLSMVTTLAP